MEGRKKRIWSIKNKIEGNTIERLRITFGKYLS